MSDLFETVNLELQYPELLRKCVNVQLDISNEDISKVELDTRSQAKGSGFFRHRAGRIGASVSGAVCHCNLAQPPQSLTRVFAILTYLKLVLRQHGMAAFMKMMLSKHMKLKCKKVM